MTTNIRFLGPVLIGDTVTVRHKNKEIDPAKRRSQGVGGP
jgi:acyl dehydratase